MQAFIVSLLAGCLFPLLPLLAEYGLKGGVGLETLAPTTAVYVAAIGLVSRSQAVLVSALCLSPVATLIYGAAAFGRTDVPFGGPTGAYLCYGALVVYAMMYVIERLRRHVIEGNPFLEI